MNAGFSGSGKLPGKTKFSGRRRLTTRRSGFSVNPDTTGGEFKRRDIAAYSLDIGEEVSVTFEISRHGAGELLGYGTWFRTSPGITIDVIGGPAKKTLTNYGNDSWNKVGSIWKAVDAMTVRVVLRFRTEAAGSLAVFGALCGRIHHKHLDDARDVLIGNMFQFAPEAIFVDPASPVEVTAPRPESDVTYPLILKSCNRCGRYLPVNYPHERDQLSFSSHCVAAHRLPCEHGSFGRLRNVEKNEFLKLRNGFQLECRFCKKFEVNAAHNPQRTSAQMKEDGARRRAFELLLQELYQGTPQLRYRHQHGTELTDDVWNGFDHQCFNCGAALPSPNDMHLDHTRPLKLLWPLDGSATALCGPCNSEKRDRAPVDFYPIERLVELAHQTGLTPEQLLSNEPNEDALMRLFARKAWFFDVFLQRPEMTKVRDGKVAGELVLKALQKVIALSRRYNHINLLAEYAEHRRKQLQRPIKKTASPSEPSEIA